MPHLTPAQQLANANHFLSNFEMLNEGGIYIWKDEGCAYYKIRGKMCCRKEDYKRLSKITPKLFAPTHLTILRNPAPKN